jgi:hypothetical protein
VVCVWQQFTGAAVGLGGDSGGSLVVSDVDKYRMISPCFSSVVSKSTVYVG